MIGAINLLVFDTFSEAVFRQICTTYTSRDNRASAIVELKNTTFANTNLVQYKVGALALNTTQYSWNTGITIQQNAALLMQLINANTVTTDVKASLWYSNNATGTLYMQLEYTQPGNWQLGALTCYVNSVAASSPGQVPKRAMGYGTAKGNDIVGEKRYELANHLGNVLEVITDRKTAVDDGVYNLTTGAKTSTTADGFADYYLPTIVAYTDYDPYGTAQEARKGGITDYRFGFQGQEMDDEIKGEGNSVNYKYRMHDPRLGRFFAVDPLAAKYPHNSPYAFSENMVVHCIELEGLESLTANLKTEYKTGREALKKYGHYNVMSDVGAGAGFWVLGQLETVYMFNSSLENRTVLIMGMLQQYAPKSANEVAFRAGSPDGYAVWKLLGEGIYEGFASGDPVDITESTLTLGSFFLPFLEAKAVSLPEYTLKPRVDPHNVLVKKAGVWKNLIDLPIQTHHILTKYGSYGR